MVSNCSLLIIIPKDFFAHFLATLRYLHSPAHTILGWFEPIGIDLKNVCYMCADQWYHRVNLYWPSSQGGADWEGRADRQRNVASFFLVRLFFFPHNKLQFCHHFALNVFRIGKVDASKKKLLLINNFDAHKANEWHLFSNVAVNRDQ